MKALILAGGRGKRINQVSSKKNKCMIKYKNKYLIEYSLDIASQLDSIKEIVIVVGYRAEDIINHYGNVYNGKKIKYAIQKEQKGLVHAIESAKEQLNGDDFLLMLGDEYMVNPKHKEMIELFQNNSKIFIICGVLNVQDRKEISKTYTILQLEDNTIVRLIEKPKKPLNNIQGTGNCLFRNKIFEYIDLCPIHHQRGEKELPDLIQSAIDDGKKVLSFNICDEYKNVNIIEELV